VEFTRFQPETQKPESAWDMKPLKVGLLAAAFVAVILTYGAFI
jgi:hypothetical protein